MGKFREPGLARAPATVGTIPGQFQGIPAGWPKPPPSFQKLQEHSKNENDNDNMPFVCREDPGEVNGGSQAPWSPGAMGCASHRAKESKAVCLQQETGRCKDAKKPSGRSQGPHRSYNLPLCLISLLHQ